MCFHVVPIWSPRSLPMLPPGARQGPGAAERGRARSSPDASPGRRQPPRSPTPRRVPRPVLSLGGTGNLRPPARGETGSQQIPAGDTMPGKVPAGLHPVEGLTSLLWRSARPQASSSHRGLIFICHWVICGGKRWAGSQERPASLFSLRFALPSCRPGLRPPPPRPRAQVGSRGRTAFSTPGPALWALRTSELPAYTLVHSPSTSSSRQVFLLSRAPTWV